MSLELKEIFNQCIYRQQKTSLNTPPDTSKARLVTQVAGGSLADYLGIQKGDYLLQLNGYDGINANVKLVPDQGVTQRIEYYLPRTNEALVIETNGYPMGIESERSPEGIFLNYKGRYRRPDDLYVMWRSFGDDALIALAIRWQNRKAQWLRKTLPGVFKDMAMTEVELLFHGVALFENGQTQNGMMFVGEFINNYQHHHEMHFSGVAHFYWYQELKAQGKQEEAIAVLKESYRLAPVDRIKRKMVLEGLMGIDDQVEAKRIGHPFPLNYQLPMLNRRDTIVSLSEYLDELEDHQLMIVCALGGYRSNGPYDQFVRSYIQVKQYFGDVFSGVNVIAGDYNNDWTESEREAIASGLNVAVLYDESNVVGEALESAGSPDIYILDYKGVVVSECDFERISDVWALYLKYRQKKVVELV
ncbi:hypothetical protein [Reinekea blandensis]|uniref:PDZ domain-containing protein n=1 Tax=Reinekea blandensis MED297 TaxID=314283 RepID=A4B9H4_9GAMM|nr:hypothetical protein [Reinekea blandensis]EAR11275.1 hypothetical protein MED297_20347 [Reinekea sp. MED297] [Reinekea blandensis MED297]